MFSFKALYAEKQNKPLLDIKTALLSMDRCCICFIACICCISPASARQKMEKQERAVCGTLCLCLAVAVMSAVSLVYLTVIIYLPTQRELTSGINEGRIHA